MTQNLSKNLASELYPSKVDNLLKIYMASVDHLSAPWGDIDLGSDWYTEAQNFLVDVSTRYNVSVELVAAITAVNSPSQNWAQNKVMTIRVLDNENVIAGIPDNVQKARNMLDAYRNGLDFMVYLRGPKVTKFYENLLGKTHHTTIDRWAFRAWNFTGHNPNLREYEISVISADYRTAAAIIGLEPSEFQAVVWEKIRKLLNNISYDNPKVDTDKENKVQDILGSLS